MMPSFLRFTEQGWSSALPLPLMLRVLDEAQAWERKHRVGPSEEGERHVALLWDPAVGVGRLTQVTYGEDLLRPSSILEEAMPVLSHESPVVWVPANTKVYATPEQGAPRMIAVLPNGLFRVAEPGEEAELGPVPTPAHAPDGFADAARWCIQGEVGQSSAYLCWRLFGVHPHGQVDPDPEAPQDPDDLRRCVAFLDAVPAARARLDLMRDASDEWAQLVQHWSALEASLREAMTHRENAEETFTHMSALRRKPKR